MNNSINIFCFHGKPCVGKDTQAEFLSDHFVNSTKISTGEIYRGAKNKEGEYAKYYEALKEDIETVNNGGLIRDYIIVPIVGDVIKEKISEGITTFIFTGFPRTIPQHDEFNKMLYELSKSNFIEEQHIYYEISDETAIKRSQIRRNIDISRNNEPRKEDEPNTFLKRLDDFQIQTLPMIQKIGKEDVLLTLDGSKIIDEVTIETLSSLGILRSHKERV